MAWRWWCMWVAALLPLVGGNVVYYQRPGATDVIARSTDAQATAIVGSSAWNTIVGMAVHEEKAMLYWSDGSVIWRSSVDGTNKTVFLGAIARVTWKGYNFGGAGTPLKLTVLSQPCSSIVSRTPTVVTCVMRVSSVLDKSAAAPIAAASVSMETDFGSATGTTDGADEMNTSKAFTKPLVKTVSIAVDFPTPHALAIDNVNADSAWLYFGDPLTGSIYQTHVEDSRISVVVAREWGVRGLSIFGSTLRYSVESKGAVFALDVANSTAVPTPIATKLRSPRGIALDHINRRLYVVEKGGKIHRAHADGLPFFNNLRELVLVERVLGFSTLTRLNGVALDVANGVLYWTECSTNVVARASLSSMERQVVTGGGPNSMALNWPRHVHFASRSGKVYFSEYGGRISTGDAAGPFTSVVNDVSVSMVDTNALDLRPVHFFALD